MKCVTCSQNFSQPARDGGYICCPNCGVVIDEDNFTNEPTFVKNSSGQSQLSGTIVRSVQNKIGISDRTYDEASYGIKDMIYALGIDGGDSLASQVLRLFVILVERNFTKGRKRELVQASCLYICCRINLKPYLLIDFSEHLGINVYVLGTVFLQICKALSLVEHDFVQKPVDPSLFIHRFTDNLFKGKNHSVAMTALRIIASMKRDWMQTGRKPSGLCGAALYISSLSHGLNCTKSDIIKVVHVCEATLTKRLIEFENTESGSLTIEEFTMKSKELEEEEERNRLANTGPKASKISEFLCKHDESGKTPFAHGLCKECYDDFIKISGGLDGGLEPPAFQRAERKRLMAMEAANDSSKKTDSSTSPDLEQNKNQSNSNEQRSTLPNEKDLDHVDNRAHVDPPVEDSETLSDVDDGDVDEYLLHTEEEKHLKKIVWEEMNKEYLEEQAIKEEAEKAAREAYEARIANCTEEEKANMEFAATAAANAAKSRKEKQRKRAAEAKASAPPRTAAEAVKQMLDKKRLTPKIRYDVLEELLDETENLNSNKKMRIETEAKQEEEEEDNVKDEGEEFEGTEDDYYLNDNGEYDPEFEDPYNQDNTEEYGYNEDYNNDFDDF